jgi:hypothetical protein
MRRNNLWLVESILFDEYVFGCGEAVLLAELLGNLDLVNGRLGQFGNLP